MAIRNDIHSEKHYYNDADGDKHPTSLWTSTRTVEVDSDNLVNNETTLADATSWDNTYDATATQPSGLTSLISKCTTFFKNVKFLKNKTDELTTADTELRRDLDDVTNTVDSKVSKSGDTMTGELVVAKDSGSATVRVRSGDKACVLYAQSDMRGLSTGGNTILGVDNDIKMYIVGNDYAISNPAKFRAALSLDSYYQAKGSYLTTSAASSTYLTKTDATSTYLKKTDASSTYLTKTDATSTYLKKTDAEKTYLRKNAINIVDASQSGRTYSVSAGGTYDLCTMMLTQGTYIITTMTSWKSGSVATDGHVVGHQISTSGSGTSGINNCAQVTTVYGYYNNTRPSCTTVVEVGSGGATYHLVAYNRCTVALTCDGYEMIALQIK